MEKKPIAQKSIEGTARPDRVSAKDKNALVSIPDPPRGLSAAQKRVFEQLARHLVENATMVEIDVVLLAEAARVLHLVGIFGKKIKTVENVVGTTKKDYKYITPEFLAYERLLKQFQIFADQLGIGVKSREKIHAFTTATMEEADPVSRVRKLKYERSDRDEKTG